MKFFTIFQFIVIVIIGILYVQWGYCEDTANLYITGIPPIAGIVEHIILEGEEVQVLSSALSNPHTYDIKPRDLERLTQSRIFFHTQFPFELKLVKLLADHGQKVICVDVTKGVVWRKFTCTGHLDHHSRDSEPKESHHTTKEDIIENDPHCWLSPNNIHIIANNVFLALADHNPIRKEQYKERFNVFVHKLSEIDKQIRDKLIKYQGRKIFVFHPAFGYFTDHYGLQEVPIEFEGRAPSSRQIKDLIRLMSQEKSRVIFIQPQFDSRPAQTIAKAVKADVVELDDLNRNVLENLLVIAERIERSFLESPDNVK